MSSFANASHQSIETRNLDEYLREHSKSSSNHDSPEEQDISRDMLPTELASKPASRQPEPPTRFRLLDLAPEVRLKIYEFCLRGEHDTPIGTERGVLESSFNVPCATILRAPKQLHNEAIESLYAGKTFFIRIYHDTRCLLDSPLCPLRQCSHRCIYVNWSFNEQSRTIHKRHDKALFPPWIARILSAYIEVRPDPLSKLVCMGNILAALNSFLHDFARHATSLKKVHVAFIRRNWEQDLDCQWLYNLMFPITRCQNLQGIFLWGVGIPDRKKLEARLRKRLDHPMRCPDFEYLKEKVEAAQRSLLQGALLHMADSELGGIWECLKKPEYHFRTMSDVKWTPLRSAMAFQIQPLGPEERHAIVGIEGRRKSLCKGEKFYRRLHKANLDELARMTDELQNSTEMLRASEPQEA